MPERDRMSDIRRLISWGPCTHDDVVWLCDEVERLRRLLADVRPHCDRFTQQTITEAIGG